MDIMLMLVAIETIHVASILYIQPNKILRHPIHSAKHVKLNHLIQDHQVLNGLHKTILFHPTLSKQPNTTQMYVEYIDGRSVEENI